MDAAVEPALSFGFLGGGGCCWGGGFNDGFTFPLTLIISPVLARGLGGGGCLLGSVGRSDAGPDDATTTVDGGSLVVLRDTGGGVMGRGIRRGGGGDGEGDGGRGRIRGLGGGDDAPPCRDEAFLLRGNEYERDL